MGLEKLNISILLTVNYSTTELYSIKYEKYFFIWSKLVKINLMVARLRRRPVRHRRNSEHRQAAYRKERTCMAKH